jgi:uncharacterized membrane protein YphA (DoxX/SURF4 family)
MSRFCYRPSLGLLLIRVVIGIIFIHHGWMKFGNEAMTMGMMTSIGFPGFMAYAITTVEMLGGALIILGIITRAAAVATGIAMLVAISLVTAPHRGLGGSELEIMLAAVSFGLALIGAGKYRILHLFEHDREVHSS